MSSDGNIRHVSCLFWALLQGMKKYRKSGVYIMPYFLETFEK